MRTAVAIGQRGNRSQGGTSQAVSEAGGSLQTTGRNLIQYVFYDDYSFPFYAI